MKWGDLTTLPSTETPCETCNDNTRLKHILPNRDLETWEFNVICVDCLNDLLSIWNSQLFKKLFTRQITGTFLKGK